MLRRLRHVVTLLLLLRTWMTEEAVAAVRSNHGRIERRSLQSETEQRQRPHYFDSLRLRTENITVETGPADSRIFHVTLNNTDADSEVYRLADIKTFMPFSNQRQGIRSLRFNDAFTAMLAVWHFNNPQLSPILDEEQLQGCNVKLTLELLDTEDSPIHAVRTVTSVLERPVSFQSPPVTAVVGSYRSAVTIPLAIVTGVNDLPQVSWASTSVELEDTEVYPRFGRTVTSTVGEAKASLRFFQSIGATHVAILYVTERYGTSLQKAFQDEAAAVGIVTQSVSFRYEINLDDPAEVYPIIAKLKKIGFRHFYAIIFPDHFDTLMTQAYEQGIVGPDYFYLFPAFDVYKLQQDFLLEADSPLVNAYNGAAFVQMQGVVSSSLLVPGEESVAVPSEDSAELSGFDRLRLSWSRALEDPEFPDYVRSKFPASLAQVEGYDPDTPFEFADGPGGYEPFLYDAVTGLGLSMCQAGQTEPFFNGPSIFDEFTQLDFHGGSGQVQINDATGTRDYSTIAFVLWNAQLVEPDVDGYAKFQFVPSRALENDVWVQISNHTFIYADGTETPPPSLPPVNYDFNYIGQAARTTGYVLMGLAMLCAVVSLGWLAYYRKERVVSSSQPLFLVMVSVGSIILSSAIVPLSMEEPVADSKEGLDSACMASPWLFYMGTTVALSSLVAKSHGVYQAYVNPNLEFIHVSSLDILRTMAIMLAVNLLVLITWTLVSPLQWTRVFQNVTDRFDRMVESQGTCESENGIAFAAVLGFVNLFFVLVGFFFSYQSRNIETEYSDGKYVGMSMAAVLQSWLLGGTILAVVWNNTQARFYVEAAIIFVTSLALIGPNYVPKMIFVAGEDGKKQAFHDYHVKSGKFRRRTDDGFDDDDSGDWDDADCSSVGDEDLDVDTTAAEAASAKIDSASQLVPSGSSPTPKNVDGDDGKPAETSPSRRHGSPSSGSPDTDGSSGKTGVKVLHHPRTTRNLELAGGRELSREQLHFFQEAKPGSERLAEAQANPLTCAHETSPIQEDIAGEMEASERDAEAADTCT